MDDKKKRLEITGRLLTRNWILNLAGQVLPLFVALPAMPYVIRGLGTERFGILSIAWVLLSYTTALDLGLGASHSWLDWGHSCRGGDASSSRPPSENIGLPSARNEDQLLHLGFFVASGADRKRFPGIIGSGAALRPGELRPHSGECFHFSPAGNGVAAEDRLAGNRSAADSGSVRSQLGVSCVLPQAVSNASRREVRRP